jgi:hypothetical protein
MFIWKNLRKSRALKMFRTKHHGNGGMPKMKDLLLDCLLYFKTSFGLANQASLNLVLKNYTENKIIIKIISILPWIIN